MFNKISDKQYLYTLFMPKKSHKRTEFVTLLEFGIIPWNSFHLGKWHSGDASSMFLLIIVKTIDTDSSKYLFKTSKFEWKISSFENIKFRMKNVRVTSQNANILIRNSRFSKSRVKMFEFRVKNIAFHVKMFKFYHETRSCQLETGTF